MADSKVYKLSINRFNKRLYFLNEKQKAKSKKYFGRASD